MRIHFLIDYLALAGTEKQMLALARGLSEAGHDVEYSVLWTSGHDVAGQVQQARSSGVTVHDPIFGSPSIVRLAPAISRIRRRLAERRTDVLHTAMSSSELVGAAAAGQRVPVRIVSRRYLSSARPRGRVRGAIQRGAAKSAAGFVANSSAAFADAVTVDGLDPTRGVMIPNLLTREFFQQHRTAPTANRTMTLITVANIRREKGHFEAVAAARLLRDEGVDFEWLLAGATDQAGELEAIVSAEKLPIRFLGSVSDPKPLYGSADIYVHPSWSEGMPNAVLEAMAAGIPVIATDVGGTAEALAGTGTLLHPGDPVELANALRDLIADSAQRRRMGALTRERAQDFRSERCVAAHLDFYRDVLVQRRQRVLARRG